MEKIIDKYIKEYLGIDSISTNTDKFIYVNKDASEKKFKDALANFYNITKIIYFKDGVMVCIINNYLLTFDYKFKEIKSLYDYAKNKGMINVCKYISDFLMSYQFALNSDIYQKNKENNIKFKKAFFNVFERKKFYNEGQYLAQSLDYCLDFLKWNDYDFDYINDRLVKFKNQKMNNKYRQIINKLLEDNNRLTEIFKLDYDYKEHRLIYNTYITNNIYQCRSIGFLFDDILNLISMMHKNGSLLDENTYVVVSNQLINEINEIVDSFNQELGNVIDYIYNVEQILKAINVLREYSEFYAKYKLTFEKCIQILLYCKRRYFKGKNIDNNFSVIRKKIEIDAEIIKKIKEDLEKSYQYIFNYLQVDFDSELESAIRGYSKSPVIALTKYTDINSDQGTYFYWDNIEETKFSIYYNQKGKQFTQLLSDELINKYQGNYYYLMLRQLTSTFTFAGNILAVTFKELLNGKLENYICDTLLNGEKEVYLNDYILCTHLILYLESLVYEQMNNVNLEFEPTKMFSNIEQLFDFYKNDDFSRNVYMFVNYVLYDEYGLKYRNNFMHGNFIHKNDLMIELLLVFSCVIGLIMVSKKHG